MILLPVRVTKAAASEAPLSSGEPTRRAPSGKIHIDLPKGHLPIAGSPDMDCCVLCWSICCDDRTASGNTDLDCRGCDGDAAGFSGAERDGIDGAGAESVFGSRVCVSREARRPDQSTLVERRRAVFVGEAAGARALRVAAGNERDSFAQASAAVDAVGRDRLAAADAQLESANGVVNKIFFCFLFFSAIFSCV